MEFEENAAADTPAMENAGAAAETAADSRSTSKTSIDSTKKTVFFFIPPRKLPRILFIFFLRDGLLYVLFPNPPIFSIRRLICRSR